MYTCKSVDFINRSLYMYMCSQLVLVDKRIVDALLNNLASLCSVS
jgi:hypothetical protein